MVLLALPPPAVTGRLFARLAAGLLVAAAALLPALARAQAAPDLRQTWRGFVSDPRTDEHRIELALWPVAPGRHAGLAWYQEPRCRGELVQLRAEDGVALPPLVRRSGGEDTLWFREQASGPGRCGNGGLVAVTVLRRHPQLGASLLWQRVGNDGRVWAETSFEATVAFGPTPAFEDLLREQLARVPALAPVPSQDAAAAAPDGPVPLAALRAAALGTLEGRLGGCGSPQNLKLELRESPKQAYNDAVQVEGRLVVAAAAAGAQVSPEAAWRVEGVLRSRSGQVAVTTQYDGPQAGAAGAAGTTGPMGWLAAAQRAIQRAQGAPVTSAPPPAPVAPPAGWRALELKLHRDAAGRGWAGVATGGTSECREVTLSRSDGTPTEALRRPTEAELFQLAEVAPAFQLDDGSTTPRPSPVRPRLRLTLAPPSPEPGEPWLGAPWLQLASEHGSARAAAMLGRAFEHGLGLPVDPSRAATWYAQAAAAGDLEGLRAMARLHESGAAGVPRDPARAATLTQQAAQREAAARRACSGQQALAPMSQLMLTGIRAQGATLLNVALSIAADRYTEVRVGSLAIERVDVVSAAGPDRPFICRVQARRIDASVTDLTPYRRWAHLDRRGEVEYFSDNADDLALNRLSAEYQTLLMNRTPEVAYVEIARMAPRRWRLTLLDADPLGTLARRLYVDISGP